MRVPRQKHLSILWPRLPILYVGDESTGGCVDIGGFVGFDGLFLNRISISTIAFAAANVNKSNIHGPWVFSKLRRRFLPAIVRRC